MLYLLRSFGRTKKQRYLKVGYTRNLNERMNSYRTNNPFFELITTREGTLEDETRMHLYLQALGLKADFLNEWFLDTPRTITEFHTRAEKIDKVIWENRDKVIDLGNEMKLRIYENLRMLYMRPGQKYKTLPIDTEWKKMINKKYLRKFNGFLEQSDIEYIKLS